MTATVLVALTSFWAELNGKPILVGLGERYWSDHPVVAGREVLFGPAPVVDVPDPP